MRWRGTQLLVAALADAQAPQPIHGYDQHAVADLDALRLGPTATTSPAFSWPSVTGSFMPRSSNLQALAAAQIEIAVREMQVAVADAGGQHFEQHLRTVGLGSRPLLQLQRRAALADMKLMHGENPRAGFLASRITADWQTVSGATGYHHIAAPSSALSLAHRHASTGATERTVERCHHPPLGEIERRRLPVARPRQVGRDFLLRAGRDAAASPARGRRARSLRRRHG